MNSGITVQRLRGRLRVVLFSSNVSYYLKSDKIWTLFLGLVGNSEADLEEGAGGPGPPRYLWTKLRPERSKKKFKKASPLSQGLDDRPHYYLKA